MTLERIVRPFESKDVFTARRLAPSAQPSLEEKENVVVRWGKAGTSTYTRNYASGVTEIVSEWEEVERKTEIVRVENPQDPLQWVDVERVTEWTLRNRYNGEQQTYKFGS